MLFCRIILHRFYMPHDPAAAAVRVVSVSFFRDIDETIRAGLAARARVIERSVAVPVIPDF